MTDSPSSKQALLIAHSLRQMTFVGRQPSAIERAIDFLEALGKDVRRCACGEPLPAHWSFSQCARCFPDEPSGEPPAFQGMDTSDSSPVTQQEIVSAIFHHARELTRLTETWPAQPPSEVERLRGILRNIGECISGHDGHVFDDIHELLEQSQAMNAVTKPAAPDPDEETPCPKRDDGLHCECWYGGNTCCACGDGDRKIGERDLPTCADVQARTSGETDDPLLDGRNPNNRHR